MVDILQIQEYINDVHDYLRQVKQPHFDIAWRLYKLSDMDLTELGYNSIYELAEQEFGLKRTSTKNYVGVARKFMFRGELAAHNAEYSYSQLVEFLPIDYINPNELHPGVTIKQIRQWRKDHKMVTLPNGLCKFYGELTDEEKQQLADAQPRKEESASGQTSDQQEKDDAPMPSLNEFIDDVAPVLKKVILDHKLLNVCDSLENYIARALYFAGFVRRSK